MTTKTPAAPLRLFLGGDAMLGRMVGACIGRFWPDYPHILDYGVRALRDTIATLDLHGIAHAGAGRDLADTLNPAIVDCRGLRFGMAAFCAELGTHVERGAPPWTITPPT